jgi:hypothetical protein
MTAWFKHPDAHLDLTRRESATGNRRAAPHALAAHLADACVTVLGVDGAAISVVDERVPAPLGASDSNARLAARLQLEHGEGPGLDAGRLGRMFAGDGAELARSWPEFAAALTAQTPFEGVISLPLVFGGRARGALDLFLHDAGQLSTVGLAHAVKIADS